MNKLSIRTFLLLLILVASLPLVAVVGYDFYSDTQKSVAHSKATLRELANTMVSNTNIKIADARRTLELLAARPLVKLVDPKHCDPALKDMLTMIPGYANIGYVNLEGLVVCSAVPLTDGKPVNVSQRPWFQKIVKGKRFAIGNPHVGMITGKLVSVFSAPIWNDRREVVGVVFLPMDLNTFDPNIPDQLLPAGSRYGFFAEDGTMIWRNLDPEGVIGTRPNVEAARRVVEVRNGEFESLAIDGITRFYSVLTMQEAEWIAFVGLPATTIYAEARRQGITKAAVMLSAIAFLILLAISIARRIVRPIEDLERAVCAARGGDLGARVAVGGPCDIAAVASEFNNMVAAQQHSDERLRQSEGKLRAYLENISDTIWVISADMNVAYVSSSVTPLLGVLPGELIGRSSALVIHPGDMGLIGDAMNYVMEHPGDSHMIEYRVGHKDGRWISVESTGVNMFNNPAINGVLVTMRDISKRKQMEHQLRENDAKLRAMFYQAPLGIWTLDHEGNIIDCNEKFAEYAGSLRDRIIGTNIFTGVHDHSLTDSILHAMSGELSVLEANCTFMEGGRSSYYQFHFQPISLGGEYAFMVCFAEDISERKAAEEKINNLAFHDALTQLPNRRLLEDRLIQTMAASNRSGRYGAMMFLDLDNFKPLNDRFGHGVGDLLLIEVANRLTGCVRKVDTVARFGGDEFVVMLNELDEDKDESVRQAGIIAEKVRIALAEPYRLNIRQEGQPEKTVEHHCAASIGVVMFVDNKNSADDIIKWADMAMYQAKEAGRNRVYFYRS